MGLEVEFIPVRADSRQAVLPDDGSGEGTLPVLLSHAQAHGWDVCDSPTGLPVFDLADGSRLSYEPGGQIEYATTPLASLDRLDSVLSACLEPLAATLARSGIRLLARGLDPITPPSAVRRVLEGERYPRQEAHYARRGSAGRTMMLQTAGVHVNADPGPNPVAAWNRTNTLAPHLIALFANAPSPDEGPVGARGRDSVGSAKTRDVTGAAPAGDGPGGAHGGRGTGPEPAGTSASRVRSRRAGLWRVLDPTRNAVFPPSHTPWDGYARFALEAESFLLGDPDAPPRSFADWLDAGVAPQAVQPHLTTLFPEVRPRRYLEIRSVDALPLRWCIVPAALGLAVALTPDRPRGQGGPPFPKLPPASRERLVGAGRDGLGWAGLAEECEAVREWAVATLTRAGDGVAGPGVIRRVQDFFRWGLERGRDPGHLPESWLES